MSKLCPRFNRLGVSLLRWVAGTLVWIYRVHFSYILGGACRFEPSCSCYAEEALATLPLGQAVKLIVLRVSRCHPFQRAQWDPVPLSHAGGPCGTTK